MFKFIKRPIRTHTKRLPCKDLGPLPAVMRQPVGDGGPDALQHRVLGRDEAPQVRVGVADGGLERDESRGQDGEVVAGVHEPGVGAEGHDVAGHEVVAVVGRAVQSEGVPLQDAQHRLVRVPRVLRHQQVRVVRQQLRREYNNGYWGRRTLFSTSLMVVFI